MKSNLSKRMPMLKTTLLGVTLFASGAVNATNGLWLPGFGAKSVGMGGTSIALQMDSLAQAVNPAAIAGMENRLDVGAGLFNPPRRAFVDAENDPTFGSNIAESRSARDWFLIPNIGFVLPIDKDLTFGVAAIGAGLGVFYEGIYDFKATGENITINLIQLQMPFTLAYKTNKNLSVAASFTFAAQMFEANGFGSFAPVTSDVNNFTDGGKSLSYGAGVRLGVLYKNDDDTLSLGAHYHSRVYMTEFDEYAGLLAEQGDLDIPATYGIGIAVKSTADLTVAFDIVYIDWDSVASIGNKGPALFTGTPIGTAIGGDGVGALGRDDGMGFGWKDQTVYKLGFLYQYDNDTAYTVGFNYGESPVQQDQLAFGVIGPAVTEKHLAVGWQQKLEGYTIFGAQSAELSVSFLHGFKEKMSGTAGIGQSDTGQNFAGYVEFEMVQNQLELSYGLKF